MFRDSSKVRQHMFNHETCFKDSNLSDKSAVKVSRSPTV